MDKTPTLITHSDAEFGSIEAPLVVIDGWSHSVWVNHSTFIQIAKCTRIDSGEKHPTLDGRTYPYPSPAPQREAYEAGVLAYYVRAV